MLSVYHWQTTTAVKFIIGLNHKTEKLKNTNTYIQFLASSIVYQVYIENISQANQAKDGDNCSSSPFNHSRTEIIHKCIRIFFSTLFAQESNA